MKRTSHEAAHCPIARSLDVMGDWWTLLIVRDALAGKRRFGEFQKSLGVAKNVLAARLRALVAEGILEMVPASDGSAYQEYSLTDKGRDLFPVLVALRQWAHAHLFKPEEIRTTLVDRAHGRPVRTLELRAEDGRLLTVGDAEVRFASR
jgi:DNA-binding HxlR family transcriptional regulator